MLYSDGLTEARNESGEEFGEKRLEACFLKHVKKPVDDLKESILGALAAFSGNTSQADDITVVAVKL